MKKFLFLSSILIFSLFVVQVSLHATDTLKNKKNGHYYFEVLHSIDATEVENQSRTGTCWSFSTLSFFESELMRLGKGKHNLSEMYIVRKAYEEKAEKYVRMHGSNNFGQGGAFHDIGIIIDKYGIVPEEVYQGLNYGLKQHNHSELETILKSMLDGIIKNKQGKLTPSWRTAVKAVLDAYLGEVPEKFTYNNQEYTPKTFANSLGLKMSDYVSITSYTHHQFYESFILEVPDNWAMKSSFNVPLDEMVDVMKNAIKNGYGVAWGADVSEKGFSYRDGLAIVPQDIDNIKQKGKDNKHFNNAGAEKMGNQFDYPGDELEITQAMRQEAFDNYETTDDHGMHLTGLVKDQIGNEYFVVKNSWGKAHNDCDGYFYASIPYVKYKTMNFLVHKDALQKKIKSRLQD